MFVHVTFLFESGYIRVTLTVSILPQSLRIDIKYINENMTRRYEYTYLQFDPYNEIYLNVYINSDIFK